MSLSLRVLAAIGALTVFMVSAAPVSNSPEENDNFVGQDDAVDRAKRAEEEIYFGNQQNKARTMTKKSDPSSLSRPSEPRGESDEGSEVVVHKAQPIDKALNDREGAVSEDGVEAEKYPAELESEMHSILGSFAKDPAKEGTKEETTSKGEAESNQDDASETVQAATPGGEAELARTPESNETSDIDEEEKDLQEITSENSESTQEASRQGNENVHQDTSNVYNDVESTHIDNNDNQVSYGLDGYNDPKDIFDNYLLSRSYPRGFQQGAMYPLFLARRRRSAALASLSKKRRSRRIKRDLLDDSLYNIYEPRTLSYPSISVNDPLLGDQDDYVPLSDEEAAILYSRLIDYLANSYEPYEEIPEVDLPYEPEFLPDDNEYEPAYLPDTDSSKVLSPYDDGYPYGPIDSETYINYPKRGMVPFYPSQKRMDKRYFFPFNDEPETHWGAFVPEKRDNGEAIQRLQRLAMALSDNPAPFYKDMLLEDYRRK